MERILASLLLTVIACLVVLWFNMGRVFGHGWYDYECCSDNDCAPIDYVPKPLPGGSFLLPTGEVVPREKVKWSKDEHYHLCRIGPTIFCLYVPPQGS